MFEERSIQIDIESYSTTSSATATATTKEAEEIIQQLLPLYIIIIVSVLGAILVISLVAINHQKQ